MYKQSRRRVVFVWPAGTRIVANLFSCSITAFTRAAKRHPENDSRPASFFFVLYAYTCVFSAIFLLVPSVVRVFFPAARPYTESLPLRATHILNICSLRNRERNIYIK